MRPLGTLIVQEQPCVFREGNNAGKFRLDKLQLADPLRIDPQAEKKCTQPFTKTTGDNSLGERGHWIFM